MAGESAVAVHSKGRRGIQPPMNATPLLSRLLAAFADAGLEAILIGNAAAALHGAPVTTLDFDFFFRDTPKDSPVNGTSAPVFRPMSDS
jgi:hypothetical protein